MKKLIFIIILIGFPTLVMAERSKLLIFKYSATSSLAESDLFDPLLNEFMAIILDKLRRIPDDFNVSESLSEKLSNLEVTRVTKKGNDQIWAINDLTLNDMLLLWDSRNALSLLHGRIVDDGTHKVAKTSFYMGDYKSPLPKNFNIQINIIDKEYENTRDSHSAMVMYSFLLSELNIVENNDKLRCKNAEIARELLDITQLTVLDASQINPQFKPVLKDLASIHILLRDQC